SNSGGCPAVDIASVRPSHPCRNMDHRAPDLPLSVGRKILMNSERPVNLATINGTSLFNQLKNVDLIGCVPGKLFEFSPPLTYMFSAFRCRYLHELLRAVRSDCHDVGPKEVDLLPLGSIGSSCDVLLLTKPVLCRDLG